MLAHEFTQLIQRRRRRRSARSIRTGRGIFWSLWSIFALLTAVGLLALIGIGAAVWVINASLPNVETLPLLLDRQNGLLLQPTRFFDRTGSRQLSALENPGIARRFLPLKAGSDALSPALAQTAVLVLQPDFWQDNGGTWRSLTADHPLTITERLVKNILMPETGETALDRLRLRLTASQILYRYGHAQVLEWYLNSASFGHLTFGAETAAQLYLGKSASQIDWLDAALLTAALEAPALNPLDAPAAAHENQLTVLARMAAGGLINEDDVHTAFGLPAVTPPQPKESGSARAFTALVLERLAGSDINRAWLERGGLRIQTTLDSDLQQQLACTIHVQLGRMSGQADHASDPGCGAADLLPALPETTLARPGGEPLAASGVILDPTTGQVLALVGDTTLDAGEGTLQSHPTGPLQAPFLALAGFARRLSPASLIWDLPPAADQAAADAGAVYHGPVRLRTALVNNYLPALVNVLDQIGSTAVTATARSLGLQGYTLPLNSSEALAIGPSLAPLDMAGAYSVFSQLGNQAGAAASEGTGLQPQLILQVEDAAGQSSIEAEKSEVRPVVSPQLAYLVHHVLAAGTDPSANPLALDRPAGGKVGTADSGRSTWAAGYTRQTAAVIWLGYARPRGQNLAVDAAGAAGVWRATMEYASRNQPAADWQMPNGVTLLDVCDPSGQLPTANCPNVVTEVFLADNLPAARDDLYQKFQINRETGRLATIFSPPELVEERTFLVVPPEAQRWIQVASLPLPPTDYDNIQQQPVNLNVNLTKPDAFAYIRGKVTIAGTASGDSFRSYRLDIGAGINPTSWTNILDSQLAPIVDGTLGTWDTAGLDGLYVIRLMVIQEGQRVELAYRQVTVDNTPPQASIPYPLAGQVFTGLDQRTITLQAEILDAVGIARVEWWLDGSKLGERSLPSYALIWDGTAGKHRVQVRATDLAGNEAGSEEINFTVQ